MSTIVKYSDVDQDEVCRLYELGETYEELISAGLCHGRHQILSILRKNNVNLRHLGAPSVIQRSVIQDYNLGMSLEDIAVKYEYNSVWSVNRTLLKFHVPRNRYDKRKTLNHHSFDVLTPEACYWLGFIFADGCVTYGPQGKRTTFKITLKGPSYGHLEMLRDFLGSNHEVYLQGSRAGRFGVDSCSLEFASEILCNRILQLGRYNENIPAELTGSIDFWRGMIDGDGWVTSDFERPTIALCGEYHIIEYFISFIKSHVETTSSQPKSSGSIFRSDIRGRNGIFIINMIYNRPGPALKEKQSIAFQHLWRWIVSGYEIKKSSLEELRLTRIKH